METISSQDFLGGGKAKKVNEQGSTVSLDDFNGGGKIKIISTQQPNQTSEQPSPQKTYTAGEALGSAAKNIVPSAISTITEGAKGIGQAILHPIETGKGIVRLAEGTGTVIGEKLNEALGRQSNISEEDKKNALLATNVGNAIYNRYGNWENIKRTAAEDPAGFLLDLSTVLTGGETALGKIGEASKISSIAKAGEVTGKLARTIDPITGAVKITGKVAPKVAKIAGRVGGEAIGTTTGTGYGAVNQLYQSIKEGGTKAEEAYKALRGETTPEEVVGEAKDTLSQIYENRSKQYQEQASKLRTKPGVEGLSTQGVKTIAKDTLKNKLDVPAREIMNQDGTIRLELDFSQRPSLDSRGIQNVSDTIYNWKDTTIQGINRLKQEIEGFKKGGINLSPADNRFNKFINDTSKGLDNYLKENIQGYEELNKTYKENTDLIKQIESNLSVGKGKNLDTAYRKLSSVLRTNNEFRASLAKELDDLSGGKLLSKVAGQQLSEISPRGIAKPLETVAGLGALATGNAIPLLKALAFTSPRIMGEVVGALGFTGRKADQAMQIIKKISPEFVQKATKAAKVGTYTNRLKQSEEK